MTSLFAVPVCHLCGIKTLTTADKVEPGPFTCHTCIAIAKERADIRSWLGQQAAKARTSQAASPIANMSAFHEGAAKAFKAAADHLKPERKPSAKLLAKRAARK